MTTIGTGPAGSGAPPLLPESPDTLSTMSGDSRKLERVREDLRRLGYLDHGFERFLLQDALKPRRPGRTLVLLASKVGLMVGIVLALVAAFTLAAANGNLTATPFDLLPLFAHLLPPVALGVGLGFLALCALLVAVLRLYHVRRIEGWSLGAALVAGAAALAGVIWRGSELLAESSPWQLVAVALVTPVVVFVVIRVVYDGLLSLAIVLTDTAPRRRLFSRRWLALAILVSVFLLMLPGLLSVERSRPAVAPATLPTAPGERVLLVGIDGVLPEELDYLLARRELPTLARLAAEGGVVARYRRAPEPPAVFWTSVATGLPSPAHGVSAVDSFRPLGVTTALARTGPLRPYWSRVAVRLGLAEHRPLLESRRRAFTVWELAARGGEPVVAVNWWSTFPARPLPGLVVAHGAYPLLAEGVPGAVAPDSARRELEALRSAVARGGGESLPGLSGLGGDAGAILAGTLGADRFYREAFAGLLERRPRVAALYLSGPDIAADQWAWGSVPYADLLRTELASLDRLIEEALPGVGTVAVVIDPGRRSERPEGRVVLWRRAGCAAAGRPEVDPLAVTSGLLRALGLPQSAELPLPPGLCSWPVPNSRVATFGERRRPHSMARRGGEYLESLRALGYL